MRRKTLLVTGASAGTGATTAQAAAAASYDTVIINYRSDRPSADTVAQMVNVQGCEAVIIWADINDPAAVAAIFEQITALPPAALNLVNNAGIVAPKASIKDLTPDRVSAFFSILRRHSNLRARRWPTCAPITEAGSSMSVHRLPARAWRMNI